MFRLTSVVARPFSAAPRLTTGIEHAEKFNALGKKSHAQKPGDYKCAEYLNCAKYDYYDVEKSLIKLRVPQPNNKIPDVLPTVKNSK